MRKRETALLLLVGLLVAVAVGDVARIVAVGRDAGTRAGTEALEVAWACYEPPGVWVIVPGDNDTVTGITPVEVTVKSGIEAIGIDLYLDGEYAITLDSAPYACEWDTMQVADGPHTLRAVAYFADGAIRQSRRAHVIVQNEPWTS